jgi:hypothetical protein
MGFREVLQSIPIEHDSYSWGVTLVHCIDPEGEGNGKVLFMGEFGK